MVSTEQHYKFRDKIVLLLYNLGHLVGYIVERIFLEI